MPLAEAGGILRAPGAVAPASAWRGIDWLTLAAILLCGGALRVFLCTGLVGSDETVYAIRGLETAMGLWLPSDYVGDLRYGVNLPIAAFVTLLGRNMAGLHAWSLLCSLGEVALVFVLARRLWGLHAAAFAAFAMAITPLHVHVGGRAVADAPLAFFISLAFVAFAFAERTRKPLLYWLAGAAVGCTWWVKPHAIVFVAAFGIYVLLVRTWRREWFLMMAGAAVVVAAELAMFGIAFGNPFYALQAMVHGIDHNFVKSDAPWGDHAAFFYFRQMWRDGRDMGLVPVLALVALVSLLRRRDARSLDAGGYVIFWGVSLLALFSFLPYSFSPFKLMPKQENYALIFFAPVALLGGYGLSVLRPAALRWATAAVLVATSLALATLPQYQWHIKRASIDAAMSWLDTHPGTEAYVPGAVVSLWQASRRLEGSAAQPAHLHPLGDLIAGRTVPTGPAIVFLHAGWPELVKGGNVAAIEGRLPCLQRVAAIPVEAHAVGERVVAVLDALSRRLPSVIGRQLAFAQGIQGRSVVQVYEWRAGCAAPLPVAANP